MRITMSSDGEAGKIEEIYSNNGTEISGSSVAVVDKNERAMLVGSIVSDAYYCEMKSGSNLRALRQVRHST